MRPLRFVLALALALPSFACHGPEATVGGFQVAWTESPPGLTVRASDGRELLRTAGALVETRTTTASWEVAFGSYRKTELETPWGAAKSLRVVERSGERVRLQWTLDGGEPVELVVHSPASGELRLDWKTGGPNRLRASFACASDDRFLGFGGQADATDHRGHKLPIWVSEPGIGKVDHDDPTHGDWMLTGTRHASSYPLPTFLSARGFAFLADTTRYSVFDVCQADDGIWSVEVWDDEVSLAVFDGPEPLDAIERLTRVTGRQPLASDLAFAPWNDAIFGSDNVRRIARLLRDENIPSSLIWTEDFRGGEYAGENYRLLEEWDVDRRLYPDIEQLADDLHRSGFRFLAYHNTFLVDGTQIMAEAREKDVLVRRTDGGEYIFTGVKFTPTGIVDLTHPNGPSFVQHALERLIGYGFDGWMADYAEWMPPDAALANGGSAEDFHNEYSRRYHQIVADALATHPQPEYAITFARSGTLGAVRHQPVVWGGDQFTNFDERDGMPTVITMGLNLGLAGVAIYGHDIAGYQNLFEGPSTKETFFRWTVAGALSPVMRTHHGTKAKENWWFGKDADTIEHFRRWARFHIRLWPYLRLAAKDAHERGWPIMRHLALAHPDDAKVWGIKDQWLFGPSLLVAPVLTEGATARDVYLPAGTWLPLESGEALQAGSVRVDVPLTEAGVFARPGTIVPMLPDTVDTLVPAEPPVVDLDDVRDQRTLLVFGGANGRLVDLDGTEYVLESSGSAAPSAVRLGGELLGACEEPTVPCVVIDAGRRRVTVRGEALTDVRLEAGGDTVARVRVSGGLKVGEIVYRY